MATRTNKPVKASGEPPRIIAISANVNIEAAEVVDGKPKGPAKFNVVAYTGQAIRLKGWDYPVVVDIKGMQFDETLTANLDHDSTKRVGHVTEATKHDGKVLLAGVVSAVSESSNEVVASGGNGYPWKASIEADPLKVVEIAKGKTLKANDQEFTGPLHYVSESLLNGFGFVTRGADSKTSVTIAASAAQSKGTAMKTEVKAWAEDVLLLDVDSLNDDQKAALEANYDGKNGKKPKIEASNPFEARKLEAKRRKEIRAYADKFIEERESDEDEIEAVEKMLDHAIASKMEAREFRSDLLESTYPVSHAPMRPRTDQRQLTARILEAAICQTGRLVDIEKKFTDQELQLAHDRFRDGISLNQFFITAAEANGYRGSSGGRMNLEVQRAAFGQSNPRQIHAQGFSTIDVANITGAVANKFIHEGWMAVDQTPLRVAAIRSVRNFQLITTVSLTGALQFEEVGAAGEIKHGTLDEITYTNQAKTYGQMLAITRQDIINDDLGALTSVPRRLGRGGMLLLNHIFWTEFLILETDGFFASGNNNINTGVADMTIGGLDATETIFMNQTDYDGKPLAIMPAILLVPPALKNKALNLMGSQQNSAAITSWNTAFGDDNPFRGRFRVESSPYMANSAYTGYSAQEWYMLANPNELAVIEIAALNGRIEPTVDQADTDFNTLGVQMRGYCDVGVKRQEKKAGVLADGNAS